MCELDKQRMNALANIGLELSVSVLEIEAMRKAAEGLRVKDIDVLDKLNAAMVEAANYLAGELEGKE